MLGYGCGLPCLASDVRGQFSGNPVIRDRSYVRPVPEMTPKQCLEQWQIFERQTVSPSLLIVVGSLQVKGKISMPNAVIHTRVESGLVNTNHAKPYLNTAE